MDDIHLGVKRSGFSISVLLDFSKASNSMSHDLLLHKLRLKFGLSSTACKLFGSFLGPRTQEGYDNGECSDSVDISIGSVLSPILHALSMMWVSMSVIVGFIFMLTIFKFTLWMGAGM
jgi:hypothetical protein